MDVSHPNSLSNRNSSSSVRGFLIYNPMYYILECSQLISGRWLIMMRNLTRQIARVFHRLNNDNLKIKQFQPSLSYSEKTNLE